MSVSRRGFLAGTLGAAGVALGPRLAAMGMQESCEFRASWPPDGDLFLAFDFRQIRYEQIVKHPGNRACVALFGKNPRFRDRSHEPLWEVVTCGIVLRGGAFQSPITLRFFTIDFRVDVDSRSQTHFHETES